MISSILIAPDSYKGSLLSSQAVEIISDGILSAAHDLRLIKSPLADGGEGTLDVFAANVESEKVIEEVAGPLGKQIKADYLLIDNGKTAVIEMAQASGLAFIHQHHLNPLLATSYGTGQLINSAYDKGVKKIIITLGGSATVDCGAGMLQALGVKFFKHDIEITEPVCGQDLEFISDIDFSEIQDKFSDVKFVIASDVTNPLLGKNGAVFTFAPQKGADEKKCHILESGMSSFYSIIEKNLGRSVNDIPGAGAAGGMGAALLAFFDSEMVSGIKLIFEITDFEHKLLRSDLVITGEGSLDYQSFQGKVLSGVLNIAKKHDKPVVVIAGQSKLSEAEYKKHGIYNVFSLNDGKTSIQEVMLNAKQLLFEKSAEIARNILPNL